MSQSLKTKESDTKRHLTHFFANKTSLAASKPVFSILLKFTSLLQVVASCIFKGELWLAVFNIGMSLAIANVRNMTKKYEKTAFGAKKWFWGYKYTFEIEWDVAKTISFEIFIFFQSRFRSRFPLESNATKPHNQGKWYLKTCNQFSRQTNISCHLKTRILHFAQIHESPASGGKVYCQRRALTGNFWH